MTCRRTRRRARPAEVLARVRGVASFAAVLALLGGCEQTYCTDTCRFAGDGICDDGRDVAYNALCARGTDCGDCGPNLEALPAEDAYPGGYGAPEPGATEQPFTPEGGTCRDHAGAHCKPDGLHYYGIYGRGSDYRVCSMTIPRSCGDNRHCIEGDDERAVGCLWNGAGTVSGGRVVICESAGMCTNGIRIQKCDDWPALIPLYLPPYEEWYSLHYYETEEGQRWSCGAERWDHPGPPPGCYNPYPGGLHHLCVSLGADGYCGDEEECTEGTGEPMTDPIPAGCRQQLEAITGTSTGNSCLDRCVDQIYGCAGANNCTNLNACLSPYQSCVSGCY